MLVAFPNRDGEAELYLLSPGEAVEEGFLLAEDAIESDEISYYHRDDDDRVHFVAGRYGAFMPQSDHVLFWYRQEDDDDTLIHALRRGADTPTELMATDALPVYINSHQGIDQINLAETRDDQRRCYSGKLGESASRLTKGDSCSQLADGTLVYATEMDDGELTVTIVDTAEGEEQVLLDSVEAVDVNSIRFSQDGSHMAYIQEGDDGMEPFLLERETGETVAVGEPYFNVLQHSFIPKRDVLYYLAENDDGDVELHLSNIDTPIDSGYAMATNVDLSGTYLLYVAGDDEQENSAHLYNMTNGEVASLQQGEGLQAGLVTDLETIFLWESEDDEFTLYSRPLEGGETTIIFDEDNVSDIRLVYVEDAGRVLLWLTNSDGEQSIYATSPQENDGFYVVEEWESLSLLNMSPTHDRLVFAGVEDSGDDPVLLLASLEQGASVMELDDRSDGYHNAVFTADGDEILYTAVTGGDADDVEVIRIPASGEEEGELLYEEAWLDTVSWTEMNPFRYVYFGWSNLRTGTSYCPGARALTTGDEFEDILEDGENCYRFRVSEGEMITFDLSNLPEQSYSFRATIHEREGDAVEQTSYVREPWLTWVAPESGLYFLKVTGDTSEASYRLRVAQGNGEPAMAEAEGIEPGETRRGAITSESNTQLLRTNDTGYGDWYYIDAVEGDHFTFDVMAESLGSALDPYLEVRDPFGNPLDSNDDGGNGSDARLTFRVPRDGRYYLLVTDYGTTDFGTEDDFFYELQVTEN